MMKKERAGGEAVASTRQPKRTVTLQVYTPSRCPRCYSRGCLLHESDGTPYCLACGSLPVMRPLPRVPESWLPR